jgi:uncharacterized membrane protein
MLSTHPSKKGLIAAALLLAAAAALRIAGAFNDLWLDEIWSLDTARQVTSPLDVFTRLHHEINHYLNTLWMYWMGNRGNWPGYRIPSLVAGIGTVALAGLIGRRRSRTAAWLAMILTGFSYLLVLYASEARGYSTAVCFSFLAFYALEQCLDRAAARQPEAWGWLGTFWVGAALALLSHLTTAAALAAAGAGAAWRLLLQRDGARVRPADLGRLALWFAPLAAFLALLYVVDIRRVVAGGGTASPSLIHSYGTALAWAAGTPGADGMKFLCCTAAVTVLVAGLRLHWRERRDLAVFYASAILVFPVALVIIRGSDEVYTRHFVVALAFLLLLAADVLAALFARGGAARVWAIALLAAYLAANGAHTLTLLQRGRGHFRDAVRLIAAQTKGPVATIAGDHDFRVLFMLQFFAQEAMAGKGVQYFPQNQWPAGGVEWIVRQKESFETPALEPEIHGPGGTRYTLVKTFPSAPLSGLHWFIYHRAE